MRSIYYLRSIGSIYLHRKAPPSPKKGSSSEWLRVAFSRKYSDSLFVINKKKIPVRFYCKTPFSSFTLLTVMRQIQVAQRQNSDRQELTRRSEKSLRLMYFSRQRFLRNLSPRSSFFVTFREKPALILRRKFIKIFGHRYLRTFLRDLSRMGPLPTLYLRHFKGCGLEKYQPNDLSSAFDTQRRL